MQMANDTRLDEVLAALDAGQPAALDRLKTFLRIPSVSTDPAYAPEVRRAAGWLRDELAALGFVFLSQSEQFVELPGYFRAASPDGRVGEAVFPQGLAEEKTPGHQRGCEQCPDHFASPLPRRSLRRACRSSTARRCCSGVSTSPRATGPGT